MTLHRVLWPLAAACGYRTDHPMKRDICQLAPKSCLRVLGNHRIIALGGPVKLAGTHVFAIQSGSVVCPARTARDPVSLQTSPGLERRPGGMSEYRMAGQVKTRASPDVCPVIGGGGSMMQAQAVVFGAPNEVSFRQVRCPEISCILIKAQIRQAFIRKKFIS